jgi:hypothetical protein
VQPSREERKAGKPKKRTQSKAQNVLERPDTDDLDDENAAEKWTVLRFRRFDGKTLPQVLLSDPDWFFWAFNKDVFEGQHAVEAKALFEKATRIRIPKPDAENWAVEYRYDENGQFQGFSIVELGSHMHSGSGQRHRERYLDLSCLSKSYDKRGGKCLIRDFREYFFGEGRRLTKERCEAFFDDDAKFAI